MTEITVRSGGSGDPGVGFVAAAFQRETGHVVKVTYDNELADHDERIFDVVVASSDLLDREFRPFGRVEDGGFAIGRSAGLGVAVRVGSRRPALASIEEFVEELRNADALLLTTHTSGQHVEAELKRLGILPQIEAKLLRFANGPLVMERLLEGYGRELAVLSVNQIRRYEDRGLELVGLAPEEIQYAIEFVVVPMTASANKDVAWQFARFCASQGKTILAAFGFK